MLTSLLLKKDTFTSLVLLFAIIILENTSAFGQCPEGDITLKTQEEVDSFVVNYPDCSEIKGDLIFGNDKESNVSIKNLSAFQKLTSVRGNLTITRNDSLTNLTGLDNIGSLGGLLINGNTSLINLLGLNNLYSIDGDLKIIDNDQLVKLEGLESLRTLNGELRITSNDQLSNLKGLKSLSFLRRSFLIFDNSTLTSFSGLESLSSIGYNCYINQNSALTNLKGLENIISVGGSFGITDNPVLASLDGFENLKSVDGNFYINKNSALTSLKGLKNLCTIGKIFNIIGNPHLENLFGLEKLSSIGEHFAIINNTSLLSLSGLEILSEVRGPLSIYGNVALTDLSALHNLKEIGGLIIKENCNLFEYLPNLENINTLPGDLEIVNTNFPDLSGLKHITFVHSLIIRSNGLMSLNGLENLKEIRDDFLIVDNDAQVNFSGLENLVSIGGDFKIGGGIVGFDFSEGGYQITYDYEGSNSLVNLKGLENLKSIGGDLQIAHLPILESLTGIENLNFVGGRFDLFNNPMLNTCSILFTCTYLNSSGNYSVESNGQGCNNASEILENCKNLAKIKSHFFYDANQNKTQDGEEPFVSFGVVKINPGNFQIIQNPSSGLGMQYFLPGNYTFTVDETSLPDWSLTTDSNIYKLNLNEADCQTISFGIYPNQFISVMQSAINSVNTRCNDTIPFTITSKNLGTSITEGVVWFNVDSVITATQFIDQPDTIIPPNQYGWFFDNLIPSHLVSKQIKLVIPGPSNFELGDSLTFKSFISFSDQNGEQQSESFTYKTEIRCSYDPNDKLVNPNRLCNHILMDENITYTIRFQNTGNDVAYKVLITDEIDSNLDLNTFSLINSSHIDSLQTSISDNGTVTFEFNKINLPDSTSNLEGSQGYVSYSIKAKTGLPENTIIKNTSAIYFDYNPAIITNTVENILVSELPNITWCRDFNENGLGNPSESIESCEQPEGYVMDCSDPNDLVNVEEESINDFINIYPNPSNGVFKIEIGDSHYSKALISLYNANGRLIIQPTILKQNQQGLDYPNLTSGVYYLKVKKDELVLQKKLVVIK